MPNQNQTNNTIDRLTPHEVQFVTTLLTNANKSGRIMLFEHEVYMILDKLGIQTPEYKLIHNENEINANLLKAYNGRQVVLKVVADKISHKQKENGVRIVYKDLDFIKYTYRIMWEHFERKGFGLEGILLCDYVTYSKELGNEILLGFRESTSFGPVISFSKGGSDAEHFANYYSAPNLILLPIDATWARALLESTHIQKKYLENGNTEYLDEIIRAKIQFSRLAVSFSNFFPSTTPFVIKEFEVNPFVFDVHNKFLALDGYATFEPQKRDTINLTVKSAEEMKPFFEPDGIAVIGISRTDDTKPGNIILHNLLKASRRDVYAINIRGGEMSVLKQTLPLYRSIQDVEDSIDLAVVTTPAEKTLSVVEACAQKGVKALIIISSGFSEVSKNQEIEDQIVQVALQSGMHIIGPNCLGVIHAGNAATQNVNTFFIPEQKFSINSVREKNVAILTQSGALGITEIYNLRNAISPRVIVSYGNQLDVDPSDLVNFLNNDPMVGVIGSYIEGFKPGAGRKFFNTVKQSVTPVIVYKAGRTKAGIQAAQSHTASIAGEYHIAKAAMKQAGMIVADTMIDHGDFIKIFTLLKDFTVNGRKTAIIANAGYEKTLAADNLRNLEVALFDSKTVRDLEKILPPFVNVDSLLDLTPMADDLMFASCIETVLKSPAVDALFISIVPMSYEIHTTDEEIEKNQSNIAAQIVRIVHKYKKPTVISVSVVSGADAVYNKFAQIFDAGGIPTYLTANRAMVCLNGFIRYHMTKGKGNYSEWLK